MPALAFVALGVAMIGLETMEVVWSAVALAVVSGYYVLQSLLVDTGGEAAPAT